MAKNDNIPKDPDENVKRLESIYVHMKSKLQRLEDELEKTQERMKTPANGIHRLALKDKEDRLLNAIIDLQGKMEWNIGHRERIKDAVANGTYELKHRPFAQLDADVHLDTKE